MRLIQIIDLKNDLSKVNYINDFDRGVVKYFIKIKINSFNFN